VGAVALSTTPPDVTARLLWPDSITTWALPVTEGERRFVQAGEGSVAHKLGFAAAGGVRGSMVLLSTFGVIGHHTPEHCYASSGWRVAGARDVLLPSELVIRQLDLVAPSHVTAQAVYWFQSPRESTSDFSRRLFSTLWQKDDAPWVLVSILFESTAPLTGTETIPVMGLSPAQRAVIEASRAAVTALFFSQATRSGADPTRPGTAAGNAGTVPTHFLDSDPVASPIDGGAS
jgi:hypothetical protein